MTDFSGIIIRIFFDLPLIFRFNRFFEGFDFFPLVELYEFSRNEKKDSKKTGYTQNLTSNILPSNILPSIISPTYNLPNYNSPSNILTTNNSPANISPNYILILTT